MFKNNPFRVILAVIIVLIGMSIYAAVNGKLTTLPQEIMGAAAVPFKQATAKISNKVSVLKDRYLDIDEIIEENEKLKQQNKELMEKQTEYDKFKIENEQYKEFLNIKNNHPEYEIQAASVIGRDGQDKFYSFTIDVGKNDGIKENDVVLSSMGAIGIVIETGYNYARVATILSPSVNVASFVSSTRDTGVVCGDTVYSNQGKTIIKYLPKNTEAKVGDIVTTSGMGEVFPKDLLIGTIESIDTDSSGNYNYAVITPVSNIAEVKTVFVIKNYQVQE